MYKKQLTCRTCKKKFKEYPLYTHLTTRAFCSEECLAEGVQDEYGAFAYVGYVYMYREYRELLEAVNSIQQYMDLKDDIEYTLD